MSDPDGNRLVQLEQRVAYLERWLQQMSQALEARLGPGPIPPQQAQPAPTATPTPGPQPRAAASSPMPGPQPPAPMVGAFPLGPPPPGSVGLAGPPIALPSISAAALLGWAGAAALVLAAAYLVGLGVTSGWLTPPRQIGLAVFLGLGMLSVGMIQRQRDRPYSSVLAALGIVTLYVAVLGAHVIHDLVGPYVAAGAVLLVAGLCLAIYGLYREKPYVVFGLLGTYSSPFLVGAEAISTVDLAIYLTLWNAIYGALSLWTKSRTPYVGALYLSLITFDALFRLAEPGGDWMIALGFQSFQLLLFVSVVVLFSLRRPLTTLEAWIHAPALLLFYGVEYALLDEHAPMMAPLAAIGVAAVLYVAYGAAYWVRGKALNSLGLVHAMGALVLFHAVFLNLLPEPARPLAALLCGAGCIALQATLVPRLRDMGAYVVATVAMLATAYVQLTFGFGDGETWLEVPLLAAYPVLPYVVYARSASPARSLALAVGHLGTLIACTLITARLTPSDSTSGRLWVSMTWATVGTASLLLAKWFDDRTLARSSLAVFALFGAKVLLLDLAATTPLVRVGCLLVLGVSLYGGGYIYRRLFESKAQAQA